MNLPELKIATETFVKDNWTLTPIFYDLENITGEAVHLSFIPTDRELYSTHRKVDFSMLKVGIYAKNTLKALQLQTAFIALLECKEFGGNAFYEVAKYGQRTVLENKTIETILLFNSKLYN